MLTLSPADLSLVQPPVPMSPSKNPCIVRVQAARYRNDPYRGSVLPPLGSSATSIVLPPVAIGGRPSITTVIQLPPAPIGRHASHFKATVARLAAEYAAPHATAAVSEEDETSMNAINYHHHRHEAAAPTGSYVFAVVLFKHERCIFHAPFEVRNGDVVVVEGDRGFNVGVIGEMCEAPTHHVPSKILRFASTFELEALEQQRRKEAEATALAQKLSAELRLGIKIVDTEFQTDGNKLTVYFASRRPIDFRRLQRGLFAQYRCRIWLVNWNDIPHNQ